MKIAIMQPYFFPYIGYFEMAASVDLFVFLEDVQYTRGWINRNRISSHQKPFQYLTVPVKQHKRNTIISDIVISNNNWVEDHTKILRHNYRRITKHPFYEMYNSLSKYTSLNEMLCFTIKETCNYLNLGCKFARSSNISDKKSSNKIIEICKHFGATTYINASGGVDLYESEQFAESSIELMFMPPTKYKNSLSVLDSIFLDDNQLKEWFHSATPKPLAP